MMVHCVLNSSRCCGKIVEKHKNKHKSMNNKLVKQNAGIWWNVSLFLRVCFDQSVYGNFNQNCMTVIDQWIKVTIAKLLFLLTREKRTFLGNVCYCKMQISFNSKTIVQLQIHLHPMLDPNLLRFTWMINPKHVGPAIH